jgi:hypothetical protein
MRRSLRPRALAATSLACLALAAPAARADPPPFPATPIAGAFPAPPPASPPGQPTPPQEPIYNPEEHGGLSYGAWLRATRGTARRSPGMMITGVTLVGLAATLLATGTGVYFAGGSCASVFNLGPSPGSGGPSSPRFPCGPPTSHPTGIAILASGVIFLGVGIPLAVLGGAEVPRTEAASAAPLDPGSPSSLSLSLGLQGGAVALRF